MRIIFMGSPQFALPSLVGLIEEFEVVGVVTRPDRPAGRGRTLRSPKVKDMALQHGLKLLQPTNLNVRDVTDNLRSLEPDVIVVAAYGQILSEGVLQLAEHGSVNVHASLLPRWRGAAPIQAAILDGDNETGVSIMLMDTGLDTGPVLAQTRTEIGSEETGGLLGGRLSILGAKLLLEVLPSYVSGEIEPIPQDESKASHAPMLSKSDGELNFDEPAVQLARQIRAFEPWPGSFFKWNGKRIVVRKANVFEVSETTPGIVTDFHGLPAVGTKEGLLVLDEVQPAGRKRMRGDAFIRGAPRFIGSMILDGLPDSKH